MNSADGLIIAYLILIIGAIMAIKEMFKGGSGGNSTGSTGYPDPSSW